MNSTTSEQPSANPGGISQEIKDLVFESLSLTHDGIGVFDADDVLVYCNPVTASMFCLPVESATGMTFDKVIESSFYSGTGLNIETDNLQAWLRKAHQLRRSKDFRSFEVDHHDGRWWLVTEHTSEDGTILMFCSEITQQKKSEQDLRRLNEQLSSMAYRDSLTDIYNRRYFSECAAVELSRCARAESPASLLMLDLDHFKSINDNYGHESGDRVLIETTQLIRGQLRNYDIFGRLGGEEFAILLPGIGRDSAAAIAERILQDLRDHAFEVTQGELKITASIGIAEIESGNNDLGRLLRSADEALYMAKGEGRDRYRHAQ